MNENMVETQSTSLKNTLASLRETAQLLDTTESKLNYLATNTPQDIAQAKEGRDSGENPTLDSLNSAAITLAKHASAIAKHTNSITGN